MRTAALALLLSLGGCAAQNVRVTVPRACITAIALTPRTKCYGPDGRLTCDGINITFIPKCAFVDAKR